MIEIFFLLFAVVIYAKRFEACTPGRNLPVDGDVQVGIHTRYRQTLGDKNPTKTAIEVSFMHFFPQRFKFDFFVGVFHKKFLMFVLSVIGGRK